VVTPAGFEPAFPVRHALSSHRRAVRRCLVNVDWSGIRIPATHDRCFRYVPPGTSHSAIDTLNAEIVRRLYAETPYVPSTTQVDAWFAIRACYINPRTTLAEVDGLADAVRAIGDRIAGASGGTEQMFLLGKRRRLTGTSGTAARSPRTRGRRSARTACGIGRTAWRPAWSAPSATP